MYLGVFPQFFFAYVSNFLKNSREIDFLKNRIFANLKGLHFIVSLQLEKTINDLCLILGENVFC